jgi:hypothetical protein
MSADKDATLFTNGDNDTYPMRALQVVRGIRPDVTVVNLSLLNLPEYAAVVWERGAGKDAPFTEKDLRALYAAWKESSEREDPLYATTVVKALLKKVRGGDWKKPVYFAITVAPSTLAECDLGLEIEGLLLRVQKQPRSASQKGEYGVAYEKTLRLFREDFRIDSATDLGYSWPPHSAIRPLVTNYAAVLKDVAAGAAERGDLKTVRYALGTSVRILEFHGMTDFRQKILEYWTEIDPEGGRERMEH